MEEANKLSPTLPSLDQNFRDFLQKLMTQYISFYRNNPDIIRMINWQRFEYKNKKEIGISLSTEAKAWLAALKFYQDKGDISAHLKLEFVLTFILAIVSSAAMDPNVFIKHETELKDYIFFVIELLLKGLEGS